MKVQIVSDLHLEFRTKKISNILIPNAPVLAMVGDICVCGDDDNFDKFINFLNIFHDKFEAIIHVAGNHEYYVESNNADKIKKNTMHLIDRRLKSLTKKYPKYHYLYNNKFQMKYQNKDIVFVGSTLWTYIPPTITRINPKTKKEEKTNLYNLIENRMNDYRYIYVADNNSFHGFRQYTVADMQMEHKAALSFLKRTISGADVKKTYILLTHHKPLFDRLTDKIDEFTYAYESDLANTLLVKPFVLAAHGHTHIHYDKKINGVRVVSNPKGYIGQNTDFNSKFVVNI